MSDNVHYLNEDTRQVVAAIDSLKTSLVNGEVTDVMITGISKEGNILSLSSFGENILSLLGAMRFSTDHISNIIAMGIDVRDVNADGPNGLSVEFDDSDDED